MTPHDIALAGVLATMLAGALGTAFLRDVPRFVLSLGVFLLGVAGAFLVMGSTLLAVSQVFVYVGGVLVLVLFALMLVRRDDEERPLLSSKHDLGAAVISAVVFVLLVVVLSPRSALPAPVPVEPMAVGDAVLGWGLVAFELTGAVLLLALLGVLVVVKGGGER